MAKHEEAIAAVSSNGVPGYATVTTLPNGVNVVVLLQPTVAGGNSGKFGRGADVNLAQAYAEAIAALNA